MADAPMMVVETADDARLITDSEREALAAFVEANPEAGEIMPETGCAEAPVGSGGHGQTRRLQSDLLLTQRPATGVPAHRVPEEPEGESQQS